MGFQDQLSPNAGQKYCRMLQGEHSAILLAFIKLPFVIKISVLSVFEWPFYTGFTLPSNAFATVTQRLIRCQKFATVYPHYTVGNSLTSLIASRFVGCQTQTQAIWLNMKNSYPRMESKIMECHATAYREFHNKVPPDKMPLLFRKFCVINKPFTENIVYFCL